MGDMTTIMMKYMNNIDRDSSMSLDQSEFAWNFAAMVHSSADAVFNVFDANKDGKLTGNEFELWKEFSRRGMEVSLPKTGNHQKLFADCGMDTSATKDQITTFVSKMMEILRLDRWLHPRLPFHLPADVDLQAGVRRVRTLHCPPQVLLNVC